MSLVLARTGTALAVGVVSEVAEAPRMAPINLGGTVIPVSALVEGAAFVGGALLQLLSPFTLPNIVDGAVDGGAALVGKRLTREALKQVPAGGGAAAYQVNPLAYGAMAAPYALPSYNSRGSIGSVTGTRQYRLH